jgi:polysaccharide export outer membrane protein
MKKRLSIFKFLLTSIVIFSVILVFAAEQMAAEPKQTRSAEVSKKEYHIGVGDILEISTWKEPDLSREAVLVRTDGKITFPLLNDVQADGLTPTEVKNNIEARLKKFVEHPVVTVTVRDPVSQKFYILGEVTSTGEYPLVKHLTVLQAFALAGGFTEWASKNEIILLRHENGKDKVFRINYKNIAKGKDFSQNIKLKADDTIIVP